MKFFIFLIVSAVTFIGCAKNDSDSKDESSSSTAYEGTYLSSCSSDKRIYQIDISGSTSTLTIKDYKDSNCQTDEGEHIITETITLGDNVTVTKNTDNISITAQKIDFTKTKHTYTMKNSTDVTNNNASEACGFSDWEINVPKDISSKLNQTGCAESKAVGTITKEIILVNGNDLWLGDDSGSTDADNRTTVIKDTGLDKQ